VPPDKLPDWNSASPFVWLRKELLPEFPAPAFQEDGGLLPQVAGVLLVGRDQLRELNRALQGCLARYRERELSKAEFVNDHLPGTGGEEGETLTVRVPASPEEGARAKEEFARALTDTLGEQRASLLLRLADGWLEEQFSTSSTEARTVSVALRPGGSGNVTVKAGTSWLSAGFDGSHPEQIFNYVPRHLAPLFQGLLDRSTSNVDPAPPPK
jgi:hypothetical protein